MTAFDPSNEPIYGTVCAKDHAVDSKETSLQQRYEKFMKTLIPSNNIAKLNSQAVVSDEIAKLALEFPLDNMIENEMLELMRCCRSKHYPKGKRKLTSGRQLRVRKLKA